MLITNLKHINSADEHKKIIDDNKNVMICCGRMGPMCLPVYDIMEELEGEYKNVKFADMAFENPEAYIIREDPMCKGFMSLPFTVYYKNGKLVKATSSIQNENQVTEILDEVF